MPVKRELAERMMALFAGFSGAHGTHGVPERQPDGLKWTIKSTAKTLREPVTVDLWQQHLDGKRPLGVVPICADNTCVWGSIDFDEYDVDLVELIKRAEEAKFPFVPCRSKSGGLHLFLFLENPEPASDLQSALRDAAASLGLADSEIFPKQTQLLAERNDVGQWMVMPYFGDTYEGRLQYQRGLRHTGKEMDLQEFLRVAEKSKTNILEFNKLCVVRRMEPTKSRTNKSKKALRGSPCDFSDGPPCIQHLNREGVLKDGRRRSLFHAAIYFKRADPEGWKDRVAQHNRDRFSPPLSDDVVKETCNSVGKKDYNYFCKEEPMKSYCDSVLCRTRRFGVGDDDTLIPAITQITKIEGSPPVWFVSVMAADGSTPRLELTGDELFNFYKFCVVALNTANLIFKPISAAQWAGILAGAMAGGSLTIETAPAEVSAHGQFHAAMRKYVTSRVHRGDHVEDLLNDMCWENKETGEYWISHDPLWKFMLKEKVPEIKGFGSVQKRLKEIYSCEGSEQEWIGDDHRRVWKIPVAKLEQLPDVTPSRPPGGGVM